MTAFRDVFRLREQWTRFRVLRPDLFGRYGTKEDGCEAAFRAWVSA